MKKETVKDIPQIKGKTIFLRVEFNVSLSNGKITNDIRIKEALPTIQYLLDHGAKLVLGGHLGRPKGQVNPKYSLAPVARRASELLKQPIHLVSNFWEEAALAEVALWKDKSIILLENLRFHSGEEQNDKKLAKHLSKMAQIYVNDAFGATHRAHASIVGIPEYLPAYAGFLLDKEISIISNALEKPKKPFVVVIGGAKTPEKIGVIEKLLDIGDTVLLGGAIANTFLAAWGFGMGRSMVDHEMIEMSRVLFWKSSRQHSALLLPTDVVISDADRKAKPKVVPYNEVNNDAVIYDIGPQTCKAYSQIMRSAKTIIWNGPMGLFEDPRFSAGTECILDTLKSVKGATTIIGGGETLSTIHDKDLLKSITHISTGGGATLEFLRYGTLPGIEVLKDK